MLDEDDLEAAVAEGIVTPAQLEALRAFAGSRRHAAERADDERFRFMRGFNDFFFAVGVVLFGIGIAFFAGIDPIKNLLAARLIWVLAEFLVRRMRLVLPGILLACLFVFFAFRLTELDWSHVAQLTGLPLRLPAGFPRSPVLGRFEPIAIAAKALVAGLAATAFYARFRLPFALLLIAASIVLLVIEGVRCTPLSTPRDTFAYLAGLRVWRVRGRDGLRPLRPYAHDARSRLRVLAASAGGAADCSLADPFAPADPRHSCRRCTVRAGHEHDKRSHDFCHRRFLDRRCHFRSTAARCLFRP